MRYSLQELKISGYTYYEIIDTENNKTIYRNKDCIETLNKFEALNNELLYNSDLDKWETKT